MNVSEVLFLKNLYYAIILILVLALALSIISQSKQLSGLSRFKVFLLYPLSIGMALYFGFRDYEVGFDTKNYEYSFQYKFSVQEAFQPSKDFLWDFLNYFIAQNTDDVRALFILVAMGYLILPILGVYKHMKEDSIYFFLVFIISPNFFLYGSNTIRSGLAASVVLFSFRYYRNYKQYLILVVASLIHLSMIVPSFFFFISKYIKSIFFPIAFWFGLLLITLSGINLLAYLPISIDRLQPYIDGSLIESNPSNALYNFFIYSVSPILIGIYTVYIRKVNDDFYKRILITYILSNCIYVIAFNSSFSVRFAYISEFLMPIALVYPLLKFKLWKYTEIKITSILILLFLIKSYKILSI